MQVVQLIENNVKNVFFKNKGETGARRLFLELFSVFKKALYEVEASALHLIFNIFR